MGWLSVVIPLEFGGCGLEIKIEIIIKCIKNLPDRLSSFNRTLANCNQIISQRRTSFPIDCPTLLITLSLNVKR